MVNAFTVSQAQDRKLYSFRMYIWSTNYLKSSIFIRQIISSGRPDTICHSLIEFYGCSKLNWQCRNFHWSQLEVCHRFQVNLWNVVNGGCVFMLCKWRKYSFGGEVDFCFLVSWNKLKFCLMLYCTRIIYNWILDTCLMYLCRENWAWNPSLWKNYWIQETAFFKIK